MTLALLRAGLRSRLMLVGVVIFVCGFMRLAHVLGEDQGEWWLGEMHAVATIVVLAMVVPTFTLLLGSMLLRGEHGPWSWALARPVARWRVLAVLVVLDASTLAACVGTMALLFGGLGYVSYSSYEREIIYAALPVLYALLYLAAAIGGARGMGSLRAGLFALVWIAALLGLARVVLYSTTWILPWLDDVQGVVRLFVGYSRGADILEFAITSTAAAIASMSVALVLVGVIIPALRAAASLPAPAKWRVLLRPPLITFLVFGAVALGLAGLARMVIGPV
jgi:hypothetical protein